MLEFAIKTGMAVETRIVRRYAGADAFIFSGVQTVDSIDRLVPRSCKAIISVGVCGGLAPAAQVGEGFVCGKLLTGAGAYPANLDWGKRLSAATGFGACAWYSTGEFNNANDEAQREQLYQGTGCVVIDDETWAVAEFAARRGIPFQAMRTVSDGAHDNLPQAVVDALNPDGTDNLLAVIESVAAHPSQIPSLIKTALEAKKSFDTLEAACREVGPTFHWH